MEDDKLKLIEKRLYTNIYEWSGRLRDIIMAETRRLESARALLKILHEGRVELHIKIGKEIIDDMLCTTWEAFDHVDELRGRMYEGLRDAFVNDDLGARVARAEKEYGEGEGEEEDIKI